MFEEIINNIQIKRPLVHNITNYVAATDCANITLAVGASPVMADEPMEVSEVTSIADGLVLNTGTISERRFQAMLASGKAANKKGIPIVLDPVGAGISKFRTNSVTEIIAQIKPQIIRLNVSELKSICLKIKNISGVDAESTDNTEDIITLAKRLANETGSVVGVSGVCDIITDSSRTAVIRSGHEMMRKITGSGCMLSSAAGAFAAANSDDIFTAVTASFAIFGMCGEKAYHKGIGVAAYKNNFFDEMTNPDTEGIKIEYR